MARRPLCRQPRWRQRPAGQPIFWALALLLPAQALAWPGAALADTVLAGTPVICTTSWAAPLPQARGGLPRGAQPPPPVLLTNCQRGQNIPELMERRMMTHRAPYAPGVSLLHQFTDLFGIALGGVDGDTFRGLGFPDQTIVWDGTAVGNTYQALLEEQSQPLAWRTADVQSGISGSLAASAGLDPSAARQIVPWQDLPARRGATVRGLW
jgi:hypothetical protein